MELFFPGVVQPDGKIRLHIDLPHPVQCHHIEFPDGFVVFRRIACRRHHPSLRQSMGAEGLVLQKLQHGGRQCLGDTVDLVQKQDSLPVPRSFHGIVHRGNDLTHGIFRHSHRRTAVGFFHDFRQAHGALPGVVGHSIGHQLHAALGRRLFHNGSLSDTRRAHQQQRTLLHRREAVRPLLILLEICPHGMHDFFLRLLNIHSFSYNNRHLPHLGTSSGCPEPCSSTKAVS